MRRSCSCVGVRGAGRLTAVIIRFLAVCSPEMNSKTCIIHHDDDERVVKAMKRKYKD